MIRKILEAIDEKVDYTSGKSPRERGAWSKRTGPHSKGRAQQRAMRLKGNKLAQRVIHNPGTPPYEAELKTSDGDHIFSETFDDFLDAKITVENWKGEELEKNPDADLVWTITDAEYNEMEEG